MVPEQSPPRLQVMAKTDLVDTETGRRLGGWNGAVAKRELTARLDTWGLRALDPAVLTGLLALSDANRYAEFRRYLRSELPAGRSTRTWLRRSWSSVRTAPEPRGLGLVRCSPSRSSTTRRAGA